MTERIDRLEAELAKDREHLRATLAALEEKMSPRYLLDEAMHLLGSGPGEFASRLGRQVQANPVPTLLTGVGLAWLMAGSRSPRGDGPAAVESADSDLLRRVEEDERRFTRRDDEDELGYQGRILSSRASLLGVEREDGETDERFRDRVARAYDDLKRRADDARRKMADAASQAGDAVKGAAGKVAHGASAAGHAVSEGASSVLRQTRHAGETARDFHDENPLASGAVAVAIGAILGSLMPLSRQEEQAFKGLADEGLARAADAAKKTSGLATEAAHKAGEKTAGV